MGMGMGMQWQCADGDSIFLQEHIHTHVHKATSTFILSDIHIHEFMVLFIYKILTCYTFVYLIDRVSTFLVLGWIFSINKSE